MMPLTRVLIVDASPFIGLAKIGREDLLTLYSCPVLLPETVVREIEAGPRGDAARLALSHPWVQRWPDGVPSPALLGMRLDAGERAVLSLGLAHPGALLILDDGDGRRASRALSLPFTGTVGIALQARQTGRLAALAPLLRDLQNVGLYLPTDAQIQQLLAPLGESWP